jgi:hypothetical protein
VDLAFEDFKVDADCDSSFDTNCPMVVFGQEVNYTLYSPVIKKVKNLTKLRDPREIMKEMIQI